jgi:hypothetical protein
MKDWVVTKEKEMSQYDRYCDRCKVVKLTNGLGNQIVDTTMWHDSDDEVLCGQCYDTKHHIQRKNCPVCGQEIVR